MKPASRIDAERHSIGLLVGRTHGWEGGVGVRLTKYKEMGKTANTRGQKGTTKVHKKKDYHHAGRYPERRYRRSRDGNKETKRHRDTETLEGSLC